MNGNGEDGHLAWILQILVSIATVAAFIHVMIGLHHMHLLGNPGWPWDPSGMHIKEVLPSSNDTSCPLISSKSKG